MTLPRQYNGRKFVDSDYYQPIERYITGASRNRIWVYTVEKANEFTRDFDTSKEDNGKIKPTGKTLLRIVRWRARNDNKKNIKYWRTGGRNN